ncbi:gliding motility protein GldM [Mucilaginibacter koreensis]
MLGILYLVLLGLVAINIPDNLLAAFKNISDSLDASRGNVDTGIKNTYAAFQTKLKEQPDEAKPLYEKAQQATSLVAELDTYVESLKKQLVEAGGGFDEKINDYKGRDNQDVSPRLMIDQKNGVKLRQKINETRGKLLALLGKDSVNVNLPLQTLDPKSRPGVAKTTWQESAFGDGVPMGAAMTSLSKVQADAKNSENEVVKAILGKVDQAKVVLNTFVGAAVAPSSYVIAGQKYTADIFLTAYDKNSNPNITVNGSSIPVSGGKGTYSVTASGEGMHKWNGFITVPGVNGAKSMQVPVNGEYMVARPSAVVSPDKMNVLYIGVPNPVSVSAPGVAKEDINVSMSGGSISGSGGHYTVKVSSPGAAKITVSSKKGGVLGAMDFRVKRIPDPIAVFAGKSGGATGTANIKGQDRVFARLDNFDFDAKFSVTRFTMSIIKPRQDIVTLSSSGGELTGAMKAALAGIGPGSRVALSNIVAVGPDGSPRSLNDVLLTAN